MKSLHVFQGSSVSYCPDFFSIALHTNHLCPFTQNGDQMWVFDSIFNSGRYLSLSHISCFDLFEFATTHSGICSVYSFVPSWSSLGLDLHGQVTWPMFTLIGDGRFCDSPASGFAFSIYGLILFTFSSIFSSRFDLIYPCLWIISSPFNFFFNSKRFTSVSSKYCQTCRK